MLDDVSISAIRHLAKATGCTLAEGRYAWEKCGRDIDAAREFLKAPTLPAWTSFSVAEPKEPGEYVLRYRNRALCTFPTLESALGAYWTYGAIEWLRLPDSKEAPPPLTPAGNLRQ